MLMPFGKHKGVEIEDLPDDYLEWLLGRDLYDPLLSEVMEEVDRRAGIVPTTFEVRPADVYLLRLVIDLGYRAAALTLRPDQWRHRQKHMVCLNALSGPPMAPAPARKGASPMKRGTPDHHKMMALARELKVPSRYALAWANGTIERSLAPLHRQRLYPQGDIGLRAGLGDR